MSCRPKTIAAKKKSGTEAKHQNLHTGVSTIKMKLKTPTHVEFSFWRWESWKLHVEWAFLILPYAGNIENNMRRVLCEKRRKLVVWRKSARNAKRSKKRKKGRKRENSTTSSLDKVVEMALGKICWCGVARSGSQARGQHLSFRRVCCLTASRVRCDESRKRQGKQVDRTVVSRTSWWSSILLSSSSLAWDRGRCSGEPHRALR